MLLNFSNILRYRLACKNMLSFNISIKMTQTQTPGPSRRPISQHGALTPANHTNPPCAHKQARGWGWGGYYTARVAKKSISSLEEIRFMENVIFNAQKSWRP